MAHATGPALTQAERDEILRRHNAGESRNSIAKAVGRAPSTISKIVGRRGGSFARAPEVVAATEARIIDLADRRTRLAEKLQGIAERLTDDVYARRVYWDWGGKDHDYDQREHDPTAADQRSLLGAAAIAIDRSLKLLPPKDDTGAEAAKSMLGALAAALLPFGADTLAEEDSGEG